MRSQVFAICGWLLALTPMETGGSAVCLLSKQPLEGPMFADYYYEQNHEKPNKLILYYRETTLSFLFPNYDDLSNEKPNKIQGSLQFIDKMLRKNIPETFLIHLPIKH